MLLNSPVKLTVSAEVETSINMCGSRRSSSPPQGGLLSIPMGGVSQKETFESKLWSQTGIYSGKKFKPKIPTWEEYVLEQPKGLQESKLIVHFFF